MNPTEKVVLKSLKTVKKEIDFKSFEPDMLLREHLGLDSIKLILLFNSLCNKFKVKVTDFSDEELLSIHTIGDLIKLFKETKKKYE